MTGVYLIHFSRPFGHARHYVGFAEDIDRRFKEHKRGYGSHLTRAVVRAGIGLDLVRVWPDHDRSFERRLHNQHGSARFCPVCRALQRGGSQVAR